MKSVDYLGQEGQAAEFQIVLKRGLEKNRTWIIFFLKVLHPPSWLRKCTLQWCMQESQVAVVIVVAKASQNLPLNDTDCKGQSQGWHSISQAVALQTVAAQGWGSLCSVSTGCGCPGLGFPMHSVEGTVTGLFAGTGVFFVFEPTQDPWEVLSCSSLMGCAVLLGLN